MAELALSLLISACLGALIGLFRQWEIQQESPTESEFAGVRTFTIVAMLGCISAYTGQSHAPGSFVAVLVVLGAILAVSKKSRPAESAGGQTTPGAVILTLFTGGLVFWGERGSAVLVATLTVLLLSLKQPIHQWTRRFTVADARSALQFVAITGVILPLVPNRDLGPYGAFNPFSMWLMVVLISGLGFLGYILMRLLGNQAGISLTGLVGGLASSTATTLAFSRRSRDDPARSLEYALGVVLASNVMIVRVLIVVAAIHAPLAWAAAAPLAAMLLPGLALAAWMWLKRRPGSGPVDAPPVSNPLSLKTAIHFAMLYALVKLLVKMAQHAEVDTGVLVLSGIAGLTDVDAITVSTSDSARQGGMDLSLAARAIAIACISNTVAKAAIGATLGSPALRQRVAVVLGVTIAAGIIATAF